MKSLAILLVLAGASTALAGAPKKPVAPKKPNIGDDYDVFAPRGDRRYAKTPTSEDHGLASRGLSRSHVASVVQQRRGEIEYCWAKLPVRAGGTAVLHFVVEPAGTVATLDVDGDVPAAAAKCIATVAKRWTFAAQDSRSEIAYPIALRSL